MPQAPNIRNLLLGRGAIYFDRLDANGVGTGERHLGNCSQFETSMEDDRLEVPNYLTQSGGTYREITRQRDFNVSITLYEVNPENAALIVMGDVGTLAQTGSTVTGEALGPTPPSYGVWYKTLYRDLSSITVDQGATELTVDEDYEVDARTGRIRLIEGGPNVGLVATTVDYTYGTISLNQVSLADKAVIEGLVRYIGDPAVGGLFEVVLHKVSWQPDGVLSLIGDDVAQPALAGRVLDDSTNNAAPYNYGRLIELQSTYR